MQLILLITKHSLCVTCGSQWSVKLEEVAHSFWRAIPCSVTGFWTEFWLDIFFFWRVNAKTWCYSIKTILREEFSIVSKFNFPQEEKRSGLPLPSYINFSPLTAKFSWKNHNITQRKIQTWVPFRQKGHDYTFFKKSKNCFIKQRRQISFY